MFRIPTIAAAALATFAMTVTASPAWAAPKDLKCEGCIELDELEANSVDSSKIIDGTVSETDLGFDPATQAELVTHTNDSDAHHVAVDATALEALIDDLQARLDALTKTVFVTSDTFNSDLGGVAGADAKCQAAADDATSIVPSGTYLAWISDTIGNSPDGNFTKSGLPYVLPDGTLVASDYTDLTDGTIDNSIDINEFGVSQPGDSAWTNTSNDGTRFGADALLEACGDWTPAGITGGGFGIVGENDVVLTIWTVSGPAICVFPNHLYCFQQ